jgi:hypothetical protein
VAAPTAFYHTAAFGLSSTTAFATPPAGKALIIRSIQVDVFNDPTPGEGQHMHVYADATCSTPVADVNPPGIGVTVLPFDRGVAIRAGSGMSASVGGKVGAEIFVDGYTVPASAVPAAAHVHVKGAQKQQQRPIII